MAMAEASQHSLSGKNNSKLSSSQSIKKEKNPGIMLKRGVITELDYSGTKNTA